MEVNRKARKRRISNNASPEVDEVSKKRSSGSDLVHPGDSNRLSDDDDDNSYKNESFSTQEISSPPEPSSYSDIAQKMMARMGYQKGTGLGKSQQGRVDIIEASRQRGRRGLGLTLDGLDACDASWKEDENVMIRQDPDWIPSSKELLPALEDLHSWTSMSARKDTIDDEVDFCSPDVLEGVLQNKSVFDNLADKEFLSARTRANPYETIRGAMFMNRAAMKMAEIDASFGFMFTNPKDDSGKPILGSHDLLYFSDICAGPGGFSEYVLWRKKWKSKGFGFTLKAEWANDFKLEDFIAGTPETFDCHYGENGYDGDGDIFKERNLVEFQKYVLANSDGKGVHFVMADGGFSVEGQENIQEILSKQLYLCQFVCALSILREGGHFLCKLFDLYTPFSVGLVYLMYQAFDQVCIFKPVTSRPANSERYIVCKGMRQLGSLVHKYLFEINVKLNRLKSSDVDIREVVPTHLIQEDSEFYDYIVSSNNTIGARQILGLKKLATFVQNTSLEGPSQSEVRRQCLAAWDIPDQLRSSNVKHDPDSQLHHYYPGKDPLLWMNSKAKPLDKISLGNITSVYDHKCMLVGGERHYLFWLGKSHVFTWTPTHKCPSWKRVESVNFGLPKDTLLDVEFVQELRGEGRGQRKMLAIHIIDVLLIGGEKFDERPLSERLKALEMLVKALSKPCRNDITKVRLKDSWSLKDTPAILNKLKLKQMKSRPESRLCMSVDQDSYFVPMGMYVIRKIKDPWHLQYSRSSQKFYFFNSKSGKSVFEASQDSVADAKYCLQSRLFWEWSEGWNSDTSSDVLNKQTFLDILASKEKR